jgi:mannose-6-phosphate isomerase-like protein (cupin superfamily)
MGSTADVTHGHKSRTVEEEKMEKEVAHIPPDEGRRSLWVFGELVTHKVPSHRTGGAYVLFEVATEPGAGPPPHINHREVEAFYVLEGEYEFFSSEETLRAGAGLCACRGLDPLPSRIFSCLTLPLQQPQFPGSRHGLVAGANAELSVEVLGVGLDRSQGDEQFRRDLPIGKLRV